MREERIYFKNEDGPRLHGVLTRPTKKTSSCIILCHGITVDKEEGGVFTELAKRLAEAGLAVFRFDFRGHGRSEGSSTEVTVAGEQKDLEAAAKFLAGLGYKNFGIVAASFAGGPASFFVARHQSLVRALVLWNALIDYRGLLKPRLSWPKKYFGQKAVQQLETRGFMKIGSAGFKIGKNLWNELNRLHPYRELKKLNIPVLFIHGDQDTYVSYQDSVKYSRALRTANLVTIRGAEHGFIDKKEWSDQAIEAAVCFFASVFKARACPEIINIDPEAPEASKLKLAAAILKKGGLVAFPTETVYGLGANALDPKAVKKIFKAKQRPADNPLIVHIADKQEVLHLAREVSKEAGKLMSKFWPGPLTLVFKKSKLVPKECTGGLRTVAVRMPASKIALALIKEFGPPIAAPSANLFGKPSPTSAQHVLQDLAGRVDLIIDGGQAEIGVESSVVDLSSDRPVLLRPGGVTLEDLKKVVGKITVHPAAAGLSIAKETAALSPGMKYKHYAPEAELIVVEGSRREVKEKMRRLVDAYSKKGKRIGVMTGERNCDLKADVIKFVGDDQVAVARNLFAILREFDRDQVDVIIAEGVAEKGLGLAIMNRLRKASTSKSIMHHLPGARKRASSRTGRRKYYQ